MYIYIRVSFSVVLLEKSMLVQLYDGTISLTSNSSLEAYVSNWTPEKASMDITQLHASFVAATAPVRLDFPGYTSNCNEFITFISQLSQYISIYDFLIPRA